MVDRFATQTGQSPTTSRSPLYTRGSLCVVKSCGISASNSAAAYAWAGCGSLSTKSCSTRAPRGHREPGRRRRDASSRAQVERLFLLGGDGKHITLTYNIRSVIPQQKICIFRYFVLYFDSCAHVLEFNNATFFGKLPQTLKTHGFHVLQNANLCPHKQFKIDHSNCYMVEYVYILYAAPVPFLGEPYAEKFHSKTYRLPPGSPLPGRRAGGLRRYARQQQ